MGKKFGMNSKVVEARERKALQDQMKQKKLAEKKEAEEAKHWSEGAHHNPRKEAEEAKRLEKLARKRERDLLEKAEMEQISSSVKQTTNQPSHIPFNSNSTSSISVYSASNIDDALELLEAATSRPETDTVEKHPERRMEAAFKRFEELEMPLLKQQNPGLRHSQLKERLFRMWKKSPDNPMNQSHISHRATREEETAFLQAQKDAKLEQFRNK